MQAKMPKSGRLNLKRFGREVTVYGVPGRIYNRFHANDTAAFVPEYWAEESVRVLTEQMVYGATVHRDFDPQVAKHGEIVHTRRPAELQGKRKQNDLDDIVDQDVSATDIEVRLNQRVYCSFVIGDGERSKSFKDLVAEYLVPGMRGNSRLLDQVLGGQVYQFLDNSKGGLGTLSKTNGHDYLLDLRGMFNDNKVGPENRWLGLASPSETLMQKTELFKSAEKIGDNGTALRNALLGRVAGWNTFLELNTPSVRGATTGTASTADGAKAAGSTTVDVASGHGSNFSIGSYFTVAGDMTPLQVASISSDELTLVRATKGAIANGAVVTNYATGLVNQASAIAAGQTHLAAASGYPANWMKEIVYDGTGVPKVGQLVSFSTASSAALIPGEYCIVQVDTVNKTILLDRPLDSAILDNSVINYGPDGDYNFGYQREALTLVNRPMALPMDGTGVRAALATFENMSLHVKISYDPVKEGHRVNIGGLFGVKTLDTSRGGVLLG